MPDLRFRTICQSFVFVLLAGALLAGENAPPTEPQIAAASDEAEQAKGSFRVPAGLHAELFAAEPLLANPVAFTIDDRGRIYVCETFRQQHGVEDNRSHGHWLDDDLAAQTVADRRAYMHKHVPDKIADYTRHDDRIRLVEDTDGDGRADRATVFADRFNDLVAGTGAGVLSYRGNVYYTCIPDLWLLRDENGDGRADVRQSLHTGYGVRFAFRGHDMHGLIVGPDGKIYFSIGDRGLNVTTDDGRHFLNPSSGAVLRCNADGSELEMIATGLRNPQELAFDDYGNLFTGDNNSDSGDKARWVQVVEGGDSGWRMEYQYLPDRGPFNREKIWHPHHDGQPAYIVPPIANFASGPSGLAFYPGTGLPKHFQGRFLLCDFRGGPANSGVRSFRLKPNGATFELIDEEETLWSILATDVDFGPDGAIYVSDWVNGWNGEGKGRIYRFASSEAANSPLVKQVQKLLQEGFSQRSTAELAGLLSYADRRVRQRAQFALVDKREIVALSGIAKSSTNLLARLHALWGLGQLGHGGKHPTALNMPLLLLGDREPEVRAQAAKVLGDARAKSAASKLIALLQDDSLRVRFHAAQSLSKLGQPQAIEPLLAMLAENADRDPVLRHAGVMGLVGSARSAEALVPHAQHPSSAARLALVVALRKLQSDQVALFLTDSDPLVVVEAARAIHDLPLTAALPALAALITGNSQDDALLRRVLNANFRLGTPAAADALAAYAGRATAPDAMRLEALAMLADWSQPSPKDRVLNFWRPLPPREAAVAATALKEHLSVILSGSSQVQVKAAEVAVKLGIQEVVPALRGMLDDKTQPAGVRADALVALSTLKDSTLDERVQAALTDPAAAVRAAARNLLAERQPEQALPLLERAVLSGELVERQAALHFLATFKRPQANAILAQALDQLLAGTYPAGARLDLLEAARERKTQELKQRLQSYESQRSPNDPLAAYAECLEGGNAERGRQIFFERGQVSCVRCHKIDGTGGEVGPDLTKIAADKRRDYLLESIVTPSKTIAKNFETVVVVDIDGKVHSGILKNETSERLDLLTAEGKLISLAQDDIEQRKFGKSSMPEDLTKHLSQSDVRDLIEFLAGRTGSAAASAAPPRE